AAIPRNGVPSDRLSPAWHNGTLPALDAMALYSFLIRLNPKQYVEIGSGNSTGFAAHAIRPHGLRTRITSIAPAPRVDVEGLCDTGIVGLLEDQPLDLFTTLGSGDVVFFDGSHFTFQNSDTVVFFLDIIPRLPAGVWVQIHDINWPNDYPPGVVDRYFSEQ